MILASMMAKDWPTQFRGPTTKGMNLRPGANVTPRPDEVHSTCNCKGAYVH